MSRKLYLIGLTVFFLIVAICSFVRAKNGADTWEAFYIASGIFAFIINVFWVIAFKLDKKRQDKK